MTRAEAWGIQAGHRVGGREHTASRGTIGALLRALGADAGQPPRSRLTTVRVGERRRIDGAVEVSTEDGRIISLDRQRLPADLPLGYHRLVWRDGTAPSLLVASPGRCYLPPDLWTWGWALQLYALRSSTSWGMGDLRDLGMFMRWSRSVGAGMTMIPPLHAVNPGLPQQPSPYYPGSRCWRNPVYLAVEDVPGAAESTIDLATLAAAGRALSRGSRIDRDSVYVLKLRALEALWQDRGADAEFERYSAEHGTILEDFATFQVLVEELGRDRAAWPADCRHPRAGGTARFRDEHRDRVRFHQWLQWLLDHQLARASIEGGLIQDLAVGVDPAGADAWVWQDTFARGVHVGAPPDAFNSQGQDWGVLAFDPWRLRTAEYAPFIQMLRWSLAGGGGLRLDHVMGLWRLFWVPEGCSPQEGAYVRYPAPELLDILALETHRACAFVIGEDLGTVEPVVRQEMAARDMLSYRLLWFERDPPSRWPAAALGAVTNHDLPTIAGLWTGADLGAQRDMGLRPNQAAHESLRRQLAARAGVPADASVQEVVVATYRLLAQAPSAIVAATLEDALGVPERQNHPGTMNEWPNWRLPLPVKLEELRHHPQVAAVTRELARTGHPKSSKERS